MKKRACAARAALDICQWPPPRERLGIRHCFGSHPNTHTQTHTYTIERIDSARAIEGTFNQLRLGILTLPLNALARSPPLAFWLDSSLVEQVELFPLPNSFSNQFNFHRVMFLDSCCRCGWLGTGLVLFVSESVCVCVSRSFLAKY